MSSKIKKFFSKKKEEAKFKLNLGGGLGQGRSLNSEEPSTSSAERRQNKDVYVPLKRDGMSHEAKAAAAAALARVQKKDSKEFNTSLAAIKAQAKRELEAEQKLKEDLEKTKLEDKPESSNKKDYSCNGVFFRCPLVSEEVLPSKEWKVKIKEFLYQQLESELGLTACLIIYNCNTKDKVEGCVETLTKYIENIINHPDEEKYLKIRMSNRIFSDKVRYVEGSMEFLKAAGFIEQDLDNEAILNDTTGTLMSCAWKSHNTRIGLIVGTGSNACYVEKVENAELFDDKSCPEKTHVLINTEWGAFGDNGCIDFIRTEFDREIDENSINRGRQLQEKMISGMYMGELARLVIVKHTKAGRLFNGEGSDLLFKRGQFFTKYVSEIEADKPGTFNNCRDVLDELGLEHATDQDCANVRYICECVSSRAAHLVSAGIAGLINKMDEPSVTVGVDGSVYRFHPKFHDLMMAKIRQFVKPSITFDLMLSEDGSGRGAALVAAVASREAAEKAASK